MNKIFSKNFFYIFVLLFSSCSADESGAPKKSQPKFLSLSHSKARIGDTLTILGENLDQLTINNIKFYDGSSEFTSNVISIDSKKIVTIVPVVYNENVSVTGIYTGLPLNIVGILPIRPKFSSSPNFRTYGTDVNHVQAITDNVYYVATPNQIYKTTDGGYNWDLIHSFTGDYSINKMFFLDEYSAWISTSSDNGWELLFTSNGGKTFERKIHFNFGFKQITGIYFTSVNNGYILTGDGEIYKTTDNANFTLVYQHPYNRQYARSDFQWMGLVNDKVLALGNIGSNGETPILIKGSNTSFESFNLNTGYIEDFQFLNEQYAFKVSNNYLYKSINVGDNWELVNSTKIQKIFFLDQTLGLAVTPDDFQRYDHHKFLITTDGGINWIKYFEAESFEYMRDIDCYGKNGLIVGLRGRIWRYIKE